MKNSSLYLQIKILNGVSHSMSISRTFILCHRKSKKRFLVNVSHWKFRVAQNQKLKKRPERNKQKKGNGWQKQKINANNRWINKHTKKKTNMQTNK